MTGQVAVTIHSAPCVCGHDVAFHTFVEKVSGGYRGPCHVGHPEPCTCTHFQAMDADS